MRIFPKRPVLGRRAVFSGIFAVSVLAFAGCGNNSGSGSSGGADGAAKTNAITIVSPHTAAIQAEFKRVFEAQNPGATVSWLDQGGTSDTLKFVRDQFARNTKEKGIGVDLFFGGGGETFTELEKDGLLVPLSSDFGVPAQLNGVPLRAKDNVWVAAALSGFGILYNKKIAERDKLPIPQTWADLANPKLQGRIQLADPRHSGSAHTIYEIILQTNGWEKGWKLLTAMSGNASSWARSSSAPLEDVQNGEAVFCAAIDFYALSTINKAGADKLGYIEPKGQNVITADPIGILPGAPNAPLAQKFVNFVMSPEGQKLWYLPKGAPGGPKDNTLYRLPAIPGAYKPIPPGATAKSDPYAQKTTAPYDSEKAAARRRALDELLGTVLIDTHDEVKAKWKSAPDLEKTGFVPVPEAEFNALALKWDDPVFAGQQKDKWTVAAREFFGG